MSPFERAVAREVVKAEFDITHEFHSQIWGPPVGPRLEKEVHGLSSFLDGYDVT